MIAKRIDLYVSRTFLVRFVLTVVIICGLYLSFDALKRVDRIQAMSLRRGIPKILLYYGYLFPARILDTVPPLLLVGAGLTLVQMSRNRELIALKASGVSLQRVTVPIFLWTLVVVILMFGARESIVPTCTRRYELLDRDLDAKVTSNLMVRESAPNRVLFVGSYDFARGTMSQVEVIDFHEAPNNNRIKSKVRAGSGVWRKDGHISLEAVKIWHFDENGVVQEKQALALPSKLLETSLVPFDFVEARQETIMSALTVSALRRHVRENPAIAQFRVMLHSRLAGPLMPFVLLLVGIPLLIGSPRATGSRVLAVVICALVAGGLYVLSFVFMSLGNTNAMNPSLAAWMPIVLVGPIGLWMFVSMRT